MVPPKDPYIRVRVLSEIGEVSLGDHSVSLAKDSLHSLRRTDAEPFISQVLLSTIMLVLNFSVFYSSVLTMTVLQIGSDGRIPGVNVCIHAKGGKFVKQFLFVDTYVPMEPVKIIYMYIDASTISIY
jgi:hypothetical protein